MGDAVKLVVIMQIAGAAIIGNSVKAHVISPRQLVEVVDISNVVVSPDGSMVAFRTEQASVERNTYDTIWYVQKLDGDTPPRRIADGGVLLRESDGFSLSPVTPVWSPDGLWVYYRALLNGRLDVWRAAVDGSESKPVTYDAADVREFRLSPDGGTLKYSVGAPRHVVQSAEQSEYDRGIRIDESIPVGQGLFRSGYLEERLATQRLRDSEVIRYPILSEVPDHWKAVDLATGAILDVDAGKVPSPFTARIKANFPTLWKLTAEPGGERIALLSHVEAWPGAGAMPDVELSVVRRRESKSLVRCRDSLCTGKQISGILWRPGSDEVLYTVTDREASQAQSIFRWSVETGEVSQVVRSDGLLSGGRDPYSGCGASFDVIVCVAASARRPPRLERIDLTTGHRETMFDPNATIASDMQEVDVRLLRWTDADGHQFNGQYFPAAGAREAAPPLFITYYRCSGFVRGGAGDEWPLVTLAGLGISSLCINAPPHDLDAVVRYELGRSAVESVVDLLGSSGDVSCDKVGMGGLSFGTEVTLWVAMNSDVLSAASVSSIAFSPMAHLLMSMQGDVFFSRLDAYWQLGSPTETPDRWQRLSPAYNLDRIRAPILMQLPEQEYMQSLDYAIPLIRDRRADLYVFPHEAHQKFQPKHKLAVYERNVDWFRFWLQGVEDTDPEKSEQYARWRSMVD